MTPSTDFTTLSMADVAAELDALAREVHTTFGAFEARQLNWKPDVSRWSVAQCLEHLVTSNSLMRQAADDALAATRPRTIWQRLPGLPRLFGRLLIRSQSPGNTRRYTAPRVAQPARSNIAPDIVTRFVEQQQVTAERVRSLDDGAAARVVMTSPFAAVITYTVLDGWRLVAAHSWRHVEQARRVTQTPGFPTAPTPPASAA